VDCLIFMVKISHHIIGYSKPYISEPIRHGNLTVQYGLTVLGSHGTARFFLRRNRKCNFSHNAYDLCLSFLFPFTYGPNLSCCKLGLLFSLVVWCGNCNSVAPEAFLVVVIAVDFGGGPIFNFLGLSDFMGSGPIQTTHFGLFVDEGD
jgi:hypothetical protein